MQDPQVWSRHMPVSTATCLHPGAHPVRFSVKASTDTVVATSWLKAPLLMCLRFQSNIWVIMQHLLYAYLNTFKLENKPFKSSISKCNIPSEQRVRGSRDTLAPTQTCRSSATRISSSCKAGKALPMTRGSSCEPMAEQMSTNTVRCGHEKPTTRCRHLGKLGCTADS